MNRGCTRWVLLAGVMLALLVGDSLEAGEGGAPLASHESKPTDWTPLLPAGSGRDYATALCGGCHTVAILALQRRSRLEWKGSLEAMNAARQTGGELCACIGGPLDEEEIEILSSYLAEAFGPNNPIDQLPLNINAASLGSLLRLPGLGTSDAQKLIAHRRRTIFKTKQEIEKLLGSEKFRRIEDFVDVKDSNFRSDGILPM